MPLPAEGTRLDFLLPRDDIMFPFRILTRLFPGSSGGAAMFHFL
jgi:hypothetical protein